MYKVRVYKREILSSHAVIESHRKVNCDIDIQKKKKNSVSLVSTFF